MNIFIIHSGAEKEMVEKRAAEIDKINESCKDENKTKYKSEKEQQKKANVLLLKYRTLWKPEAKKLIKSAQLVLYIVSKDGFNSKNIDWELRQAKKQQKAIVVWNEGNYELNKPLYEKNAFTRKEECIGIEIKTIEDLFKIINEYEENKHIHLFNTDNMSPEKLYEQYKLFTETSESLVSRRQTVNSFYITANTALITIAATAFTLNDNLYAQLIITMILSIPGILLNISWLKVMESYSLINSSKMKILGMLEEKLSASLFGAEWEAMSNKFNKHKYVSFSDREKNLPIIFNWVFGVVDVVCAVIIIASILL